MRGKMNGGVKVRFESMREDGMLQVWKVYMGLGGKFEFWGKNFRLIVGVGKKERRGGGRKEEIFLIFFF